MADAKRSDAAPGPAEFVITRVLRAPRALVFAAFTEPERMAAWFAPRGFSARCTMDARKGGTYRLVMVAPDGTEHPMKGEYLEVSPPERLVYTSDLSEHSEEWHDQIDPKRDRSKGRPAYRGVNTVTFEELPGATRVTVHMRFESPAVRDAFVKIGMEAGWSQCLDKLEALLA